jgi:hypothetical protein
MCWISNETPVLKKAEEPIPVFKILYENMDSVYMTFRYHLHTKYHQKLEIPRITISKCYIYEGIHSYDAETSIIIDYPSDSNFFVITTKKNDLYLDTFSKGPYIQVMGVIPEGAEYYRNEWGEIVSNSIILTEIKKIV